MTIGLATIIKNEFELLDKYIAENEISDLFQQIVFVDDFSTDGSYEYLSKYFDVVQHALDFNFSQQRNYASSLLNTDYAAVIDMDMYLDGDAKQLLRNHELSGADLYTICLHEVIDCRLKAIKASQPLLYKLNSCIHWVGTVHENLVNVNSTQQLSGILYHRKDLNRCVKQNQFYHDNFAEHRQIAGGILNDA